MSSAERQERFRQRQREAGRRRWSAWVTDAERAALEVELTRLRDGRRFAATLARLYGVERADLRLANAPGRGR